MRIARPEPSPRDTGNYDVYVNAVAYGRPYAKIYLDESRHVALDDIALDDARRLARAAARIEQDLAAAHARIAAPHGSEHFYHGTCQLCGKPEDDELHAERKCPCGNEIPRSEWNEGSRTCGDTECNEAMQAAQAPERPSGAGEGTRELSGPGREALAEAVAEQDESPAQVTA